ncbi:endonuclease III [Cladophialophora yegresii CBS 114405]|uniref:Endonuclease III homolog n=1 Tax=Cladophialophora yegresii CBS 114405 TaxID=1182544 RepID=W9VGN2_9EURO|nr:endonuclease III [Cladophialophora yegresii CBS 114405]EXJ54792.1 endonuclease III [Cladophialophora yegresii CBS 114405]
MRTSRIAQDTTRIFSALSPNARTGRTTRSSKRLASFALGFDERAEVKEEENAEVQGVGSPTSEESPRNLIPDIEDAVPTSRRSSRKRKFGTETPLNDTVVAGTVTKHETPGASPRDVKEEDADTERDELGAEAVPLEASPSGGGRARARARPKIPARKIGSPSNAGAGKVRIQAPFNWEEIYSIIKAMRQRNPTAPVDTMGCEDLYWRAAPPRDQRYHTLTALMLSSQTKDTVTAAAMQRLHTELGPRDGDGQGKLQLPQSALNIENVISCDATHLDSLIGKVGFHNNKTKYIKQVARILKDEYNSDIPDSVEGLVRLPGVGPKMAYLCMSAAWGKDEGIGVDVHVHRITNLWGWHKTKTPEETRMWLEGWLPRDKWHEINKMLVGLGQTVCLPVGRRCGECDLAGTGLCKAEIRGWKASDRRMKKEKLEISVDTPAQAVKLEVQERKIVAVKEELVDS